MFSVTHFRSEFIQQTQATILRKVTMTQFMLVVLFTAVGIVFCMFWSLSVTPAMLTLMSPRRWHKPDTKAAGASMSNRRPMADSTVTSQ